MRLAITECTRVWVYAHHNPDTVGFEIGGRGGGGGGGVRENQPHFLSGDDV